MKFSEIAISYSNNTLRVLSTDSTKVPMTIYFIRFKPRNYNSFNRITQTHCFRVILEQKVHKIFEELVTFLYLVVLILKICDTKLL